MLQKFIHRPVLAIVVSILIVFLGVLAILGVLVVVTMWRTGQLWTMLAPLGVG